ncbi:MAG: type II toxin-antitoxin system HicB family antitoxin [Planctomycetes bacterium]|nr:type II toxin-antitoxin system HicB family antitoxin [Planctomycetota bacterium]
MQIPVLVERVKGNGYRARGSEPFAISARGATRKEALAKLRAKIKSRLKNGTEIVGLEVTAQPHPLMEFAGMYSEDDPVVQDWKKAMARYRRKVDEHPELP